ncbi:MULTISPECIES: hypothetical protein [unclassified Pseudomonas]|uniref:hypothetical protein n=1 Tax=unclassified Pseudomonas TaxID=196821 RepID=UPI0011BD62B2|nr:hypothetical protein [Pseudomonas sp. MWU12-2020]
MISISRSFFRNLGFLAVPVLAVSSYSHAGDAQKTYTSEQIEKRVPMEDCLLELEGKMRNVYPKYIGIGPEKADFFNGCIGRIYPNVKITGEETVDTIRYYLRNVRIGPEPEYVKSDRQKRIEARYTVTQREKGVPISDCLLSFEGDWKFDAAADNVRSEIIYIKSENFDAIAQCINEWYLNEMEIPTKVKDKDVSSVETASFYTGVTLNKPIGVLNVLGYRYERIPAYPHMCDEVKDPISKKFCTGELSFTGYKNISHTCVNSLGDECGTKYIRTRAGYVIKR